MDVTKEFHFKRQYQNVHVWNTDLHQDCFDIWRKEECGKAEEENGTPVNVSMDCLSGETLGKSLTNAENTNAKEWDINGKKLSIAVEKI